MLVTPMDSKKDNLRDITIYSKFMHLELYKCILQQPSTILLPSSSVLLPNNTIHNPPSSVLHALSSSQEKLTYPCTLMQQAHLENIFFPISKIINTVLILKILRTFSYF